MTQLSPAATTGEQARPAGKPRILVADDEASMRDMLRIVLRREGYDVLVAESGREAIECLYFGLCNVAISSAVPRLAGSQCIPLRRLRRPPHGDCGKGEEQ